MTSKESNLCSLRPWRNGDACQCKFGNANLRAQTSDRWPNGLGSRRNFNTNCKKAISVQSCTRPVLKKTILKPTCVDLRWVTKRAKPCAHLREIRARSKRTQLIASHRKYLQVTAKGSCKLLQVFNLR